MSEQVNNWSETNQRYLMAALGVVREAVKFHALRSRQDTDAPPEEDPERRMQAAEKELQDSAAAMSAPSTLEILCSMFGLSAFERASRSEPA